MQIIFIAKKNKLQKNTKDKRQYNTMIEKQLCKAKQVNEHMKVEIHSLLRNNTKPLTK